MIDLQEFLWCFSLISLLLYFLQDLKNFGCMALTLNSPPSISSLPSYLSWVDQLFLASDNQSSEDSNSRPVYEHEECPPTKLARTISQEESMRQLEDNSGMLTTTDTVNKKEKNQENEYRETDIKARLNDNHPEENEGFCSSGIKKVADEVKVAPKLRKRPSRLVLPEFSPGLEVCDKDRKLENKEYFEVEGRDFFLAGKQGRRVSMEDGHGVLVDIEGDPKQAFFVVIDGHGGRAATDYVAENLGKNIVKAIEHVGGKDDELEQAIRGGYLLTDQEFLNQGVSSGACAASVLLKEGELHVANVGDCKVVMSRNGEADALTSDHRLTREDERLRIENSGGFVHCRNGVWRVHGSLAVSRAIGDQHLKQWVISEPEIKKLQLTSDCQFLIVASDGLWDKVDEQEAVDVVLRDNSVNSCKKLIDMSTSRGNMDDVTVMVINLQSFYRGKR
ncbi:probable protein phosphatase 2C 74 [Ziziphus jujuba]|uniref:Probable protein phosphatase 2C 74 n=1 Tax=Ziziphus jujuba TaxID=326968 RepID=A0A6P4AQH6_ZIZJJ|nr:probable protein phosphatase 2C 74 [Ziziphus jujuba]